jgi:hypothetical protein
VALVALIGVESSAPAVSSSPPVIKGEIRPGGVDPAFLEDLSKRPTGTLFLVGSEAQYDLVEAEQQRIADELAPAAVAVTCSTLWLQAQCGKAMTPCNGSET